jgi:hypothetical protein
VSEDTNEAEAPEQPDPFRFAERKPIAVGKLTLLASEQVRKEFLHEPTVRRYMDQLRRGVDLGPIMVAKVPPDKHTKAALRKLRPDLAKPLLLVVDGFHRTEAYKRIGRRHIEAYVAELGIHEARWYGARANLAHGRQLRSADYRRLFHAFIDAGKHRTPSGDLLTLREIAHELGGTKAYTTIRLWMQKDYPKIARLYARHDEDELGADHGGLRDTPADNIGDPMHETVDALNGIARTACAMTAEKRIEIAETMERLAAILRETAAAPSGERLKIDLGGTRKGARRGA